MRLTTLLISWDTSGPGQTLVVKDRPPYQVASVVRIRLPMQETGIPSLGWEDTLEKKWQATPIFLLGESHGQRNLVGYSPWGRKESDTTEQLCSMHPIVKQRPR